MRPLFRLVLAFALAGCGATPTCGGNAKPRALGTPPGENVRRDVCAPCASPLRTGAVASDALHEISGLAASSRHPDILYVHNDKGDSARLFAIDKSGADRGTFLLQGAQNVDWEDLAAAPCRRTPEDASSCLFVADTGDNKERRSEYVIYRAEEPAAVTPGEHALAAEAFPFRYPDGPHDAETLLVHPLTGVLTIVTKVRKKKLGAAAVYELPLPLTAGTVVTLRKVGDIVVPGSGARLTGGAVHPRATRVLLRDHTTVFRFDMRPEQSVAEALLGAACTSPVDAEKGEAIGFLPSGAGYLTVSEGVHPAIYQVNCD